MPVTSHTVVTPRSQQPSKHAHLETAVKKRQFCQSCKCKLQKVGLSTLLTGWAVEFRTHPVDCEHRYCAWILSSFIVLCMQHRNVGNASHQYTPVKLEWYSAEPMLSTSAEQYRQSLGGHGRQSCRDLSHAWATTVPNPSHLGQNIRVHRARMNDMNILGNIGCHKKQHL